MLSKAKIEKMLNKYYPDEDFWITSIRNRLFINWKSDLSVNTIENFLWNWKLINNVHGLTLSNAMESSTIYYR